jgi:C1A family cysteine protease
MSLSEQELVGCDIYGNDAGFDSGLMDDTFNFIARRGGLASEFSYPYYDDDGSCHSSAAALHVASISGHEDVPRNNEAALMMVVVHQPVSVAINGRDYMFMFYDGGMLDGDCDTDLNHSITTVGYDTVSNGSKYWLMKNSWGTSWGEGGYIKI